VTSALRPVPRKGTAPQQNGTTAEVTEFESGSFGVGLFHQKPQQYQKQFLPLVPRRTGTPLFSF
jgi:hypothetical protein